MHAYRHNTRYGKHYNKLHISLFLHLLIFPQMVFCIYLFTLFTFTYMHCISRDTIKPYSDRKCICILNYKQSLLPLKLINRLENVYYHSVWILWTSFKLVIHIFKFSDRSRFRNQFLFTNLNYRRLNAFS